MAQKNANTSTRRVLSREHIEAAYQEHENPEHPDSLSVGEYRELLDEIQAHAESGLVLWLGMAIDNEELVGQTRLAYYIADFSGHEWKGRMSQLDVDDENGVIKQVLRSVHHKQAMEDGFASISESGKEVVDLADCDVHVIVKPDAWREATAHETRELERLVGNGLSPAEALDYWMVERKDKTATGWGDERGVSHQAVSENVGKAQQTLADVQSSERARARADRSPEWHKHNWMLHNPRDSTGTDELLQILEERKEELIFEEGDEAIDSGKETTGADLIDHDKEGTNDE